MYFRIYADTLITLLKEYLYIGPIGSTKLEVPKWQKYGTLNRVIRVKEVEDVKGFLTKKNEASSKSV